MVKFCVILVLLSYDFLTGSKASVEYKGSCTFPCDRQDRAYLPVNNQNGEKEVLNRTDPTIISFFSNGALVRENECAMKSGSFFMMREDIEGSTTHSRYRCEKVIGDCDCGDMLIIYQTAWVELENYPSICDVCTGEGFSTAIALKDADDAVECYTGDVVIEDITVRFNKNCKVSMGCNLPIVCPVTNPDVQIQCPCEETECEGFCCPELL